MAFLLKSLYLRNFRNFKDKEFFFSSQMNVIHGDNGKGKTNLLEAIYLLSTGRSFRAQHLSDLICEGEAFFHLEAEIVQNNISFLIKTTFDGLNKKLQLGSTTHTTFQPLLGTLPLVLHAPSDAELITGAPNLRRRFLNLHLAQSDPLYIHHLIRYWRAMKQRNFLLKSSKQEPIECWEEEMAHSALYLHKVRSSLIEELKDPLKSIAELISKEQETHELRYSPSFSSSYLEQLKKNRPREKQFGFTLTGPHRDELSFWIEKRPTRIFGSEGQKKTTVASLKLAEWERLSNHIKEAPIMAIDELGYSLDQGRQTLFWEKLNKLGQVFITTPKLSPEFESSHKIFIT